MKIQKERATNSEVKAYQSLVKNESLKYIVLPIIDSWVHNEYGFIVMPRMDEPANLFADTYVKSLRFMLNFVMSIVELTYKLHSAGYLHGDPHLGNVMIKKVDMVSQDGIYTENPADGTLYRLYFIDVLHARPTYPNGEYIEQDRLIADTGIYEFYPAMRDVVVRGLKRLDKSFYHVFKTMYKEVLFLESCYSKKISEKLLLNNFSTLWR